MTRICVFALLLFAAISKVEEDEYFITSQTGGYTTEPAPRLPSPHRRQDEIQNKAKFNEASE